VQPGQQVYLCYGRHANLGLLVHYGFVLAQNSHDTAPLPPRLFPQAVQQQLASAGDANGPGSCAPMASATSSAGHEAESIGPAYLHANGAPSWQLLRALRLGCASLAERKARAHCALADQPISLDSERAAFEALRAACQAALAALPTSASVDERRLSEVECQLAQPSCQDVCKPDLQQRHQATQQREQPEQQQQHEKGRQQGLDRPQAARAQRSMGADPIKVDREQQGDLLGPAARIHYERLQVVLQWRLLHKRILERGISVCTEVLNALSQPAGSQQADGAAAKLLALQRKPRW
jgi:histone-lysine N-methyltransferase SETD3